mgnify:CR=1 FL=1
MPPPSAEPLVSWPELLSAIVLFSTLLFFAGEVIRPFSWLMAFGVFTGTFSSIYVAAPMLLWIEQKYPRAAALARQTRGDLQTRGGSRAPTST